MAAGHEYIFRANDGILVERIGAVNGDVFAKGVPVTDNEPSRLVVVFYVLRVIADDAAGVEVVTLTNRRVAGDVRVRPDLAVGSYRDVFINDGVWANLSAGMDLRIFVDDGSRVNHSKR